MFSRIFTLASLTLSASVLVNAVVTPSEPGPGARYTAGQTCSVSWDGDAELDSPWKDMSIQLMTGSNFQMVHITTIATDQDGTISGRVQYPCPEVNPYSTIYFYQFTSPHTDVKTWTTRFTITSPTGETTPPTEPTQPGTGDAIPWGTGALADPSQAKPPPVIGGGSSASASSSSSAPITSPSSSASAPPTTGGASSSNSNLAQGPSSGSALPSSGRPSTSPSASGNSTGEPEDSEDGASFSAPSGALTLLAMVASMVSLAVVA